MYFFSDILHVKPVNSIGYDFIFIDRVKYIVIQWILFNCLFSVSASQINLAELLIYVSKVILNWLYTCA